jgi:hypothetical protein
MTYLIKDFEDFNFNNIIFGEKIITNEDNGKYYIYYASNETNGVPKEIHIQVPETRLLYNMTNHKYTQVNIPLYPTWNKINIFTTFIDNLESHIKSTLLKKKKKYEFSNLINNKNNINNIKTNLTEDLDKVLSTLKINQEIIMIIKLSYIWYKKYDDVLRYGLSSELVDINTNSNIIPKKQNIVPIIPPIIDITPSKPRLVPSIGDLQNALKLLKKIEK